MIEQQIDLWQVAADVRCITTNGTLYTRASRLGRVNPMGAGCAREARDRYPGIDLEYGSLIQHHGHHVYLMRERLVMFPTKESLREDASLRTIERSCRELVALTDLYGWHVVAVPRPGVGFGGLRWEQVEPVCMAHFDDRFVVVSFPAGRVS